MAMMFFLPNLLLSGFAFPFLGMPKWAQWFGEACRSPTIIRIVRAIMLKGRHERPAGRHRGSPG